MSRPANRPRLIHYAKAPIDSLRPIDPAVRPNGKPIGLWVSVEGEDDWKSWCEAEEFNLTALAYPHEVILNPEANILRMMTALEIDVFSVQYRKPCDYSSRNDIDWLAVAKDYQGVIIAPYIWQRRLSEHTLWYYGWDCASGCIWDVEAIESMEVQS